MLYSLLVANIVLCIMLPLVGVFCFVKGYNLKAEKVADKPLKLVTKAKKPPEVDEKLETLLANIDAYDGTSKGQVEIK